MLKFSTHFFNMHYTFQHMLKCSTCFFMFQHMLKFSILFFNMFSTCITDFNMLWNFQYSFSTCFQHALQISTCSEIFNTLFQHVFNMHYRFQHALKFSTHFFNMFSTHFKHENLKHLQSTESHPEICVKS